MDYTHPENNVGNVTDLSRGPRCFFASRKEFDSTLQCFFQHQVGSRCVLDQSNSGVVKKHCGHFLRKPVAFIPVHWLFLFLREVKNVAKAVHSHRKDSE